MRLAVNRVIVNFWDLLLMTSFMKSVPGVHFLICTTKNVGVKTTEKTLVKKKKIPHPNEFSSQKYPATWRSIKEFQI